MVYSAAPCSTANMCFHDFCLSSSFYPENMAFKFLTLGMAPLRTFLPHSHAGSWHLWHSWHLSLRALWLLEFILRRFASETELFQIKSLLKCHLQLLANFFSGCQLFLCQNTYSMYAELDSISQVGHVHGLSFLGIRTKCARNLASQHLAIFLPQLIIDYDYNCLLSVILISDL